MGAHGEPRALSTGGTWKVGVDWRFEPWIGDPPADEVAGVELVPFVGDACVVARLANGRIMRPGGTAEALEHWVVTAKRELAEETGGKLLTLHPYGRFRCRWRKRPPWLAAHHPYPDYVRVIAWCDAVLVGPPGNPADAEQVTDVLTVSPSDAAAMFAAQGQHEYAELYLMAAELRGRGLDDEAWFRDATRLLENVYLVAADPYGQSGQGGGSAADWELGRRVVSRAISGDGTLLDACSANGLLMETLQTWCAEDGVRIEPYGLDISARLIELARVRLPRWSDRFYVGNALTWTPPRRFDHVYVLLDAVPEHHRRRLVSHLLDDVVAGGGRLIVGQYLSRENATLHLPAVGDVMRSLGFAVTGEAEQDRGERGPTQVAWASARG